MEHLDPTWISAFDDVVRGHAGLRAASADRRVVVQFTVLSPLPRTDARGTDGDREDEPVAYALVLDHGDNRVATGVHPTPDLSLTTDRRTAAAIASHTESAQTAFMSGRLRLGGDVRALIANQDLLADIDDCASSLRAATDFPTVAAGNGEPRA